MLYQLLCIPCSWLLWWGTSSQSSSLRGDRCSVLWNSTGKFPNPKSYLRGRPTKLRKLSLTLLYKENVSFKLQSYPQTYSFVLCCLIQVLLQEWIVLGSVQLLLTWAVSAPPKGTHSWVWKGSSGQFGAAKCSLWARRGYINLCCALQPLLGAPCWENAFTHPKGTSSKQSLVPTGTAQTGQVTLHVQQLQVYSGPSSHMQLGLLSNVF